MPISVPWAGYSPTMGSQGAANPSTAGTLVDGVSPIEKKLSQLMRKPQFRLMRRLLRVLDGNAVGAGGNAVENRTRVQAQVVLGNISQGGLITIETVAGLGATVAGRVTATADQTQLNGMIDRLSSLAPASYPADAGGNGGGGKNGF